MFQIFLFWQQIFEEMFKMYIFGEQGFSDCNCTKRSWPEDGLVPHAQKNKRLLALKRREKTEREIFCCDESELELLV